MYQPDPTSTPPRVQVVGLGSPHGTDQAGWMAVETLAASGFANDFPGIRIKLENLQLLSLPVRIHRQTELLVLVDALLAPTGSISMIRSPSELERSPTLSSHGLGVTEILSLSASLGAHPRCVVILGLGIGERPQPSPVLPRDLKATMPAMISRLREILTREIRNTISHDTAPSLT